MLFVAHSPIHGRGVFAAADIKAGTVLEVAPVLVLSKQERLIIDKTALYNYYFVWGKDHQKAAIGLGLASLYNHSYQPNACYKKDHEKQQLIYKALKLIKRGEEITVNYNGDPVDTSPLWFEAVN